MKFKQLGVLLSLSTIVGINVIANKALAQPIEPSITFGNAIATGECRVADQLVGPNGRSLSIDLNNMRATNGQRARCIIRVNTTIPPGFRVQDARLVYQGSVEVFPLSRGVTFNRSYSFTRGTGLASKLSTTTFTDSNPLFEKQDDLTGLFASCGGRGNFGINMHAQSSPGSDIIFDTAYVSISSLKLCD
jgi:hypothetical protein